MNWFDEFYYLDCLLFEGQNDDDDERKRKKKRKYINMRLNDIYRRKNKMIRHDKSYNCWKLEKKTKIMTKKGEGDDDDDNMNKTTQRWLNNFYEWKIVENDRKSTSDEWERMNSVGKEKHVIYSFLIDLMTREKNHCILHIWNTHCHSQEQTRDSIWYQIYRRKLNEIIPWKRTKKIVR